jgi:hypothetical protein
MSIQFSNVIKEFLKLDEEIRSLSKAKSERTKARDKLSKEISSYYKKNNIHSLNLNHNGIDRQLELVETSRMPSVNQKFLRQALSKYCNNDKIVDNMIDYILEEREQNSASNFKLKTIFPSKKKSKANIDAMALIKENEKNKIQERFEKLAQYAIAKDSIMPLKLNQKNSNEKKDTNDVKVREVVKEVINEEIKVEISVKDTPRNDMSKNIDTEKDKSKINFEKEKYPTSTNNILSENQPIIRNIEQTRTRTISIGHEVKEEIINYDESESECTIEQETESETEIDYDSESEHEEVDLDDIPMEETGYTEPPPQLDIPIEKNKTLRNVISQKLDEKNNIDVGAIPKPISKINTPIPITPKQPDIQIQDLERNFLDSYNLLKKTYFQKYPYIERWAAVQIEKIKIFRLKSQIHPTKYNEMYTHTLNVESNLLQQYKNKNIPDDVKKLQINIINYVQYRLKN